MATQIPRRYIALDVETTGLSPRTERVCEIALREGGPDAAPGQAFATLVDPGQPVGDGARAINGLTWPDSFAGAPDWRDVWPEVCEWLDGALPIVAWSAPFDRGFVEAECERMHVARPAVTWIDAREFVDRKLRVGEHIPSRSLAAVAAHVLPVFAGQPHRAAGDVALLVQVIEALRALPDLPEPVPVAAPATVAPGAPSTLAPLDLQAVARAALVPLAARVGPWIAKAKTLQCLTDTDDETCSKALIAFKDLARESEKARKAITDPIKSQTSAIEREWREAIFAPIDNAIAHIERTRAPFALARAQAAAEARRAALAEADAVAAAEYARSLSQGAPVADAEAHAANVQAVLAEAAAVEPEPVRTSLGTVRDRIVWEIEIVDAAAVPREYWRPSVEAISAAVAAADGNLTVPGVTVTAGIATTTRKRA